MDDLTLLKDDSIFTIEPMPVRPYEKSNDVVMEISIERNLDQKVISREGYTILDFLSDLGGMQGLIYSLLAMLLSFWNYNYLEDFLVSRLYRLEKTSDNKVRTSGYFKNSEFMIPRTLDNPKTYIRENLPTCCAKMWPCKPDRRARGFALARSKLELETNAIEFIKMKRYVGLALRTLLSKEQRMLLKERSRYRIISLSNNSKKLLSMKQELKKENATDSFTDGFYSSESQN